MRDDMKQGDLALFYHSGKAPAVVGTVSVVREAYPDATAQDPESGGFDPRSTPDNPVWLMVDVRFESRFSRPVPLADLRRKPDLADMQLLRKGNRLSVMPVTRAAFETIVEMGSGKA